MFNKALSIFKKTERKSREEIHQYWRSPSDGSNLPQDYLGLSDDEKNVKRRKRSMFLVELINKYSGNNKNIRILEIGCNVGRNLNFLYNAGFTNLESIEISEEAINLLKENFPEMARNIKIYNSPIEEIIKSFEDKKYDITFTMAVLEHICTESEWIFPEMARITKDYLIAVEDEKCTSWRHFPRNYKKIFEPLGMKQVEEMNCNIETHGLNSSFFVRVFKKK